MSEMIQAMCSKCKNNFMMDKELYNHRKKHGSRIICPTCLEASKENKYKKASETHKKNWANCNEEDRIKRINNVKVGIHNMSPEAKAKRSKNSSIAAKIAMNSLNEQQKKARLIKLSKANKRRYDRMKDEDRKELGRKISQGQLNMPEEKKREANLKRSESMKSYISDLTPEEAAARRQRVQDWWDNMTPEQYQEWRQSQAAGYSDYIDTLNIIPNHNEANFINQLILNGIKYQFQSFNKTKHPEFDKMFPINTITGSKFINPFHKWDFKINTLEEELFVDIDGSIHVNLSYSVTHPQTNITYNMLDYYKFRDSQRPYQTDNLNAYVIQCYDDNLTDNTPVLHINTNETITFKSFMAILNWLNLSNKSKKEIINMTCDYKFPEIYNHIIAESSTTIGQLCV